MVDFYIKGLLYKQLQPYAKKLNGQLFIADSHSFKEYDSQLEKKVKSLKIEKDQVSDLYEAIDLFGCIGILKLKDYKGAPEIAEAFSNVGMVSSDIRYLQSINAKHYPAFGDLDVRIPKNKQVFLYWFPIGVLDDHGDSLFRTIS